MIKMAGYRKNTIVPALSNAGFVSVLLHARLHYAWREVELTLRYSLLDILQAYLAFRPMASDEPDLLKYIILASFSNAAKSLHYRYMNKISGTLLRGWSKFTLFELYYDLRFHMRTWIRSPFVILGERHYWYLNINFIYNMRGNFYHYLYYW